MTSSQNSADTRELRSHPPSFDLVERPWVRVQLLDGGEAELSLREVFTRAREIRRLAGDISTQDFALLRLLLAILHDALDGPQDVDDWAELWEADDPFGAVPGYLEEHRGRFDLLDPVVPFFQTGGLRTPKDDVFSLNRIVADVPNGSPFFTMRSPGVRRISLGEAARWVVHAQAYDTSGIKTGVVGDSRAKAGKAYPQGVAWAGNLGGVVAEGETLCTTLLMNLMATESRPANAGKDDRPVWRRAPSAPGTGADLPSRPDGIRDLYTWQSRRLLLSADVDGAYGVVLTYGDPLAPQNMQPHEPMSGWRRSQAQEKKLGQPLVYMPREHDPARAAWRGLAALIAPRDQGASGRSDPPPGLRPGIVDWLARLIVERALPKGTLIRVRTYGAVYGTQQSVIDEITEDSVTMDVVLLNDRDRRLGQTAVDAVAVAESAVGVLGHLAADLAGAAGSAPDPRKNAALDRGFGALDHPYRVWLTGIRDSDDPRELRAVWQRTVRREIGAIGGELVSAAGEAAWVGRVIEHAKGQSWLDAASADLRFRSALKKHLPLAYERSATYEGDSAAAEAAPETVPAAAPDPQKVPS